MYIYNTVRVNVKFLSPIPYPDNGVSGAPMVRYRLMYKVYGICLWYRGLTALC